MNSTSPKALADSRRSDLLQKISSESQSSLTEEIKVLKAEIFRLNAEIEKLNKSANWASSYVTYSEVIDNSSDLLALSKLDAPGFSSDVKLHDNSENKDWFSKYHKMNSTLNNSTSVEPNNTKDIKNQSQVFQTPRPMNQKNNDILFVSDDFKKSGPGLRSTVLSADYIFPRSDNPLSLTPNINVQEFNIGSPEFINKSAKKAVHPIRSALKNMIAQQKAINNITSKTLPLSALVTISTEQLKKAKMASASPNAQSYMMQTDSSVLKKKQVSQEAVLANMKTYSGWKSR